MISEIKNSNGKNMIYINGVEYTPYMYRSFRPSPSSISLFHRCGVKLYQMLVSGRYSTLGVPYSNYGEIWVGNGKYDFTPFDNQMAMFKRFAPDGKFMIMVQLDAPLWWLEAHPDSDDGYVYLGKAALDEEWIRDASEYARAFIKYAEETYGEDIFAYAFSAGHCTEWFDYPGYYEPSKRQRDDYRKKFGAEIPTNEELRATDGIFMRDPSSNEFIYRDYAITVIPKLIAHFAKLFKEETAYKKITGTFYGYTVNASAGYQICVSSVGYESVWRDKNIDLIFAPTSYSRGDDVRELTGSSTYQCLVDSLGVNGKLYLHEIDHRTHLAGFALENAKILESYPDAYTTIEMLRRDLCASQCKDSALWWFDFLGGYYNCPELECEVKKEVEIMDELSKMKHESISEIAVFADPPAFNYLKEEHNLTIDYVRKNLNNLHKCGAPYEAYNLSDITRIDLKKYKMLVFLYAPEISEEIQKIIDSTPDKLKVFIHNPGVIANGKINFSAIENVTNIKISAMNEYENAVYADTVFGFGARINPTFKISDKDATVLAKYEGGDAAVGIKGDRAYCGVGNIPSSLWLRFAKEAGVHIYSEKLVTTYADSRFISCQFPGECTDFIVVKEDGIYTDLFTKKEYEAKSGILEFSHYPYQMMMFIKTK